MSVMDIDNQYYCQAEATIFKKKKTPEARKIKRKRRKKKKVGRI